MMEWLSRYKQDEECFEMRIPTRDYRDTGERRFVHTWTSYLLQVNVHSVLFSYLATIHSTQARGVGGDIQYMIIN